MTVLRVDVSFAEDAVERAIRQVALLAHGADNNATSGSAFKALFPNGLDAELRPIGASQIAAAVALRERLNTQAAAAKVKAQVMDDFDKSLAAFKSAIDARQAGDAKVSQARATELGARERFVSAYDSKDRRHQATVDCVSTLPGRESHFFASFNSRNCLRSSSISSDIARMASTSSRAGTTFPSTRIVVVSKCR